MVSLKEKVPTEAEEQIRFVVWLAKKGIRYSASANGGSRNPIEAMKLKRMGVSAGFPDVEVPYPRSPYHGLYIEFKRIKNSTVSPLQKDWLEFLQGQGYKAEIAYGFDEAKKIASEYFGWINET